MKDKIIRIYYAENETGPAELLDGRLARIVDIPVFTDEFWRDDIVKLTHIPREGHPPPAIEKVVFTRHDRRTLVTFADELGAIKLMDIFALLSAESAVILPPRNGQPGRMSVAHSEFLDPLAIARLLGSEAVEEEKSDGAAAPKSEEQQGT